MVTANARLMLRHAGVVGSQVIMIEASCAMPPDRVGDCRAPLDLESTGAHLVHRHALGVKLTRGGIV